MELEHFRYHLETHLRQLHQELHNRTYRHGSYRSFCVNDTKKREIAVASIKDRFVHRLLYEHLVNIYDRTFIYDVWSCREEKGLLAAIQRAQNFLAESRNGFFWRGDIRKFFDSVNHLTLLEILSLRIKDNTTTWLLGEVIAGYSTNLEVGRRERERERERAAERPRGIAIGNVTSQIFANIYLHEFDRFMQHTLGAEGYLRYGDDFVIFTPDRAGAVTHRENMKRFLHDRLSLVLHDCNDVIFPCRDGLKFLGCTMYPTHRCLQKRVWSRVLQRTDRRNISSYRGLVHAHCDTASMRHFDWNMLKFLEE